MLMVSCMTWSLEMNLETLACKDFDIVLTMFELQVKSIANLKGNFKYYCVSNRHPKVKAILKSKRSI